LLVMRSARLGGQMGELRDRIVRIREMAVVFERYIYV
jgi:hypothetical protein